MNQISVCDHHALRRRGRARGVLQEREITAAHARVVPGRRIAATPVVRGDPQRLPQLGNLLAESAGPGEERRGRQHHPRAGIVRDRA